MWLWMVSYEGHTHHWAHGLMSNFYDVMIANYYVYLLLLL